jgi:SagB-type dehydrogenase family enzyme
MNSIDHAEDDDIDFSSLRYSELDLTSFPEIRDLVVASEAEPAVIECRSYPGYPRWSLPRVRARYWPPLDRMLMQRRSTQELSTEFPSASRLSRLLRFGHGDLASHRRGPVPSAGGLQALELYLVALDTSWLPAGVYHYDRAGHHLSQIRATCVRDEWRANIPSWSRISGGALVWIVVGDVPRVQRKYGFRAERFLLLEAGHLMQNLCVLSASLGLVTVPQGACFERWIARALSLPQTDAVLYVAVAG